MFNTPTEPRDAISDEVRMIWAPTMLDTTDAGFDESPVLIEDFSDDTDASGDEEEFNFDGWSSWDWVA